MVWLFDSPFARYAWWPYLVDLAFVLIFVLIGRSSHGESDGLAGIGLTLWPFAVGTIIGWLGLVGFRWANASIIGGGLVWVASVFIGMLLRAQTGQGIAVSFVIVASIFLGLFLIGWRAVVRAVVRRRARGRA
ncbi:DUF3054 domain-containing protein [Frondihabitans australicus]|uniref:DUF3054 family protein n=1 Tax=Frondihabitans australicus TaxID=386892 RepID=A0A495IFA1_9MICO|nr:DUF3054 domain-containing protein [Frondihabitans australicus]RKR74682.1 hypothetical protein C8E83_1809 [Frondihabitans australicus]